MALEQLLQRALLLQEAMDRVVEQGDDDLWEQAQADWAWYRFASSIVLARDRAGGALAASLARGLLEEAAYWDWAVATGVGANHLLRRAVVEYERLRQVGREVDDSVWIGWVLPPGTRLVAATEDGIPLNAGEVVKRLGNGLADPVLAALQFRGLFAANRLLDVLTHGNLAAALVMARGGGEELPDPLAAAIVHVAAAGATAVVIAHLSPQPAMERELTDLATEVAIVASGIHRLPLGRPAMALRPAKAEKGTVLDVQSDIERMPRAAKTTTLAAQGFVQAARRLAERAVPYLRTSDASAAMAWAVFQLSWSQMEILSDVVAGRVGRALLPPAARALLEDGARWDWIRREAILRPSGKALETALIDSQRYVLRVRNGLISDGVAQNVIDDLLGLAVELLEMSPGSQQLPALQELLSAAYPTTSGVDSVRPMYSMLSQFVHATPISVLHLQRDVYTSLSAPTYAIAVEAACRGFWNISRPTLAIACESNADLGAAFEDLAAALADVIFEAAHWHTLG